MICVRVGIILILSLCAFGAGVFSVIKSSPLFWIIKDIQISYRLEKIPADYKKIKVSALIQGVFIDDKTGRINRLSSEFRDTLRTELQELSWHTSGGRIEFQTTADSIIISGKTDHMRPWGNELSLAAHYGSDIYVNDLYIDTIYPEINGQFVKKMDLNNSLSKKITIYFPLYASLKDVTVFLPNKADYSLLNSTDRPTIVFYGSSITQGASTSNSGMSYPAIIARDLNANFINLGFSGEGMGDKEIANYIANIKADYIVLDYWANPSSKTYEKTLPNFVETIRQRQPQVKIIITSPLYSVGREEEQKKKREVALRYVQKMNKEGDKNIFYFEGANVISHQQGNFLVDGRHPNAIGHYRMAQNLKFFLMAH